MRSVSDISDNTKALKRRKLSSFQIIILGFIGVIIIGALLLMLPISSQERCITPFNEALFTATSAVCVTGLVVHDTASYWSCFGQSLILLLIQIGGLGVITIAASFSLLAGRKISLMQRNTMMEAIAAPKMGGIVRLTGFIIKGTFLVELIGALCMMPFFCKDFGVKGVWMSFFHSISAFCNAGFDLMGTKDAPYASLTAFATNPGINIIVMCLIITGGIGFLTWDDIKAHKHHVSRYKLQSKVILLTSLLLIVVPAIYFFCFEYADKSLGERILNSLFQSVTTRTAGFNTTDLTEMSGGGKTIMIGLMMIGGSPGSTAGGLKTTTIAVLFLTMLSTFRKKESTEIFSRRVDNDAVKNAATILMMYLTLFLSGAVIISTVEQLPMSDCLFETASAVGTVGLTLGLTPQLSIVSQIVLMVLMFLGRVGGLTLIYATLSGVNKNLSKLPLEKIAVG